MAGTFAIPDLPPSRIHPRGWKAWVDVLDLPGVAVGITSLVLFNFAWAQAPIDGWATATVFMSLVLGLVFFGVFALVESKLSPMPLLPFVAVNADVPFVLAAVVCGWATFGVWTLYLVQILEDVR